MDAYPEAEAPPQSIVELVPVLIAVTDGGLRVLTVAQGMLLPNGPLSPLRNSLQAGVKLWVAKQTSQPMGYVEQLYTFVDTHRRNEHGMPVLYVSYLGLVREAAEASCTRMRNGRTATAISRGKTCAPTAGSATPSSAACAFGQTRRTRRKCAKSGSSAFICAGGSNRKTGRKNTFCNAMKCCMKAA